MSSSIREFGHILLLVAAANLGRCASILVNSIVHLLRASLDVGQIVLRRLKGFGVCVSFSSNKRERSGHGNSNYLLLLCSFVDSCSFFLFLVLWDG